MYLITDIIVYNPTIKFIKEDERINLLKVILDNIVQVYQDNSGFEILEKFTIKRCNILA